MKDFLLSEIYKLELHWEKANYDREGYCVFKNAYFSGPALRSAAEVASNDNIMLDFCKQYSFLVSNAYVAKLEWGEVECKENKIVLKTAILSHDNLLNKTPQLKDTDYIVIDTSLHEEEIHAFNLLYPSFAINEDGDMYKF